MKKFIKKITNNEIFRFVILGLIFFVIALIVSKGAIINSIIWGIFGSYLRTALIIRGNKVYRFCKINACLALAIIIFASINMTYNFVEEPYYLSNSDQLIMGLVILTLSIVGHIFARIGENLIIMERMSEDCY
jgi:hypothetical protein